MTTRQIARRTVMGSAAALTVETAPGLAHAQVVRWSTGTEKPATKAPPNATDCHFHTYDRSRPAASGASLLPEDASPADYRAL